MKAFFKTKALLRNAIGLQEISHNHNLLIQNRNIRNSTYAVIVFAHHRDVKVALDDLENAGFSDDGITLIARNAKRYSWGSKLTINNYFNQDKFDFNQVAQEFFLRLFQRGKYLILIAGNQDDVNAASSIMGRRQGHAEVWHFE